MTLKNGHVEFGGWTIHLQAAIQADPHGYDQPQARYGDAKTVYGGTDPTGMWVTIDCQLLSVQASHGGSVDRIPGVRAQLGRLTARLYDPNRVLDPSASPYALLTNPGAPVRLVAVRPGGTIYPLWTGVADSFEHDLLTGEGDLQASDRIALLAGIDVADWSRPQETSRSRYLAILAMVTTPITLAFEGAAVTMSAAKMSGDLWNSSVVTTAESELGIVWMDQTGRLRRRATSGLPTAIKATDCDDHVTPIIYTRLSSQSDDDQMANIVTYERVNIESDARLKDREPLISVNHASVSRYGAHALTDTRLTLPDDTALRAWASAVLDLRAKPTAEATGMEVTLTDAFPWTSRSVPSVVGLTVGQPLDITLTSRGEQERWLAAIAGISHSIDTESWVVDLGLVDGPRLAANAGYSNPLSKYNVSVYGRTPGISPVLQEVS